MKPNLVHRFYKNKIINFFILILVFSFLGGIGVNTGNSKIQVTNPLVTVDDQPIVDNKVTIKNVRTNTTGWLVIHNQTSGGTPGMVLGYAALINGSNPEVVVTLQTDNRTSTLYAMLHKDLGVVGTYEFPGVDVPVDASDTATNPTFSVTSTLAGESSFVDVANQVIMDGNVTINNVTSAGSGWLVVHADSNGAPSTVLGQTRVFPGVNENVNISLNIASVTRVLFAMLHTDKGTIGTYEFPGVDLPVNGSSPITTPSFIVSIVQINDQAVVDDKITVKSVGSDGPGWIVVHNQTGSTVGAIVGMTAVNNLTTTEVVVTLSSPRTNTLYAMLHVDAGTIGTYEGGSDTPVNAGETATNPTFILTANETARVEVDDQLTINDGVTIKTVVSAGPGWIAIHADNNGAPGTVLGQTRVSHGQNSNVFVSVNISAQTPILFAMLHIDNGTIGTYEFPGADTPVNGSSPVTNPSFTNIFVEVEDQIIMNDKIIVNTVVSAGPGWIAIHADNNGAPGTVLGQTAVGDGENLNVEVSLASAGRTAKFFAMLHKDVGAVGTYEFPGADTPVNGSSPVTNPSFTNIFVEVEDQIIMNDKVIVKTVVSSGPGWLAIHADNNGAPGTVLGQTAVSDGENLNVEVTLASAGRTSILYAMLHKDVGAVGTYEFPGADTPVNGSSPVTNPSFMADTESPPTTTTISTTPAIPSTTSEVAGTPGFEISILLFAGPALVMLRRRLRKSN